MVALPDGTSFEIWGEVTSVHHGVVGLRRHYVFADGERLLSAARMRWRSEDEVRAALVRAGLKVEHVTAGGTASRSGAGTGS